MIIQDCQIERIDSKYFNGKVDITDPCYDKGVWCRTSINVKQGTYNCYVRLLTQDYTDRNGVVIRDIRVSNIFMVINEYNNEVYDEIDADALDNWEYIDSIGVDAGLAGFFENKPDYNDNEWSKLCEDVFFDRTYGILDCGFWCSSGYGDGNYPCYCRKNENDEVIAIMIEFI